jgi:hypothetical protein
MRLLLLMAAGLAANAAPANLIRLAWSYPGTATMHDALIAALPAGDLAKGTAFVAEGGSLLLAANALELIRVWRGYEASKTEQKYEMEPEEQAKSLWRMRTFNR